MSRVHLYKLAFEKSTILWVGDPQHEVALNLKNKYPQAIFTTQNEATQKANYIVIQKKEEALELPNASQDCIIYFMDVVPSRDLLEKLEEKGYHVFNAQKVIRHTPTSFDPNEVDLMCFPWGDPPMKQEISKHNVCPLSGDQSLTLLNNYKDFHLAKCNKSGFVFAQRIPSNEELKANYATYTYYNYISPITIDRYNELLDQLETYRKTNNIIDVGCGVGHFLLEAKKRGWNVYGTEYMKDAVDKCRNKGITMHEGELDPKNYTEEFDAVISFEVIEHVKYPMEEVSRYQSILRKGGVFYFTTPNFDALERRILGPKYNVVVYPEHLSYFTKRSMHYMLDKASFKQVNLLTTGISITRFFGSVNEEIETTISEDNADENMRSKMESNKLMGFAKSIINWVLDFTSTGNSLKGLYVKK